MKLRFYILYLTTILNLDLIAQQTVNEMVFFEFNKSRLTIESETTLEKCHEKIKDNDFKQLTIIGHTDSDGKDEYNLTLSEERSKAVLNYFLSKGIYKDKIKIQFYGEKLPVIKNDSEKDKQQNRRVEIIIEKYGNGQNNKLDKQTQIFTIPTNKDTIINCAEGTIIKIKANSFVSEVGEKEIIDSVRLSIEECYKISDIILSNLSTISNEQLLETAGMINITAVSKGVSCRMKKGQSLEISFPTRQRENGMQLFSGSWTNDKHINWLPTQPNDEEKQILQTTSVFTVADFMPQFVGGPSAMNQYITSKLKYPKQSMKLGNEGRVIVSCVINEKGEVQTPQIIKGITSAMDSAAIEVIKNMPKWLPAKQKGQNVSAKITIPVKFNLGGILPNDTTVVEGNFKERFEKLVTDTNLQKVSSANIMYYVFNSTELGWINCDRFINSKTRIDYIVKVDNDIESVKVVFDRYKSVMDVLPQKGNYIFKNVPSGEKVTIVAIKRIDNKPYLAIKQTKTSSQIEKDLIFQPVTMEMLKTELKKLDRLN